MENLDDLAQETSRQLKKYFPKIKFPEEIELMKELNKQNRKEYESWLFKKRLIDKLFPYLEKSFPKSYIAV